MNSNTISLDVNVRKKGLALRLC